MFRFDKRAVGVLPARAVWTDVADAVENQAPWHPLCNLLLVVE